MTPTKQDVRECKATANEICDGALRHYTELSDKACSFLSTIPMAIETHRKYLNGEVVEPMELHKENFIIPKGHDNEEEHRILHNLICRDANVSDCEEADKIAEVIIKAGYTRAKPLNQSELVKLIDETKYLSKEELAQAIIKHLEDR
jgi:hypothetical protein